MKLDFICVGMYRAGTTWLHTLLQKHPQIVFPYEKETMFFSHHYHRGIEWYENFFQDYGPDSLVGEICPTYLTRPFVSGRIANEFPDVKILIILREPIGQIKSLYNLWRIRGYTDLSINEALLKKEELLNNVMYYQHIKRYLDHFANENVLIYFYDDLVENPEKFLFNICKMLHLDFAMIEKEDFNKRVNSVNKTTHPVIEWSVAQIGDFMRRHNLYKIKNFIANTGIVDLLKSAPSKKQLNVSKTLTKDSRNLICERVLPEIEKIQDLVKKDLSNWVFLLKNEER